MSTKETLEKAQKAAVQFLENRGHEIVQEGFEFPGYSVDIVSIDDNELVFTKVEVRNKKNIRSDKPMNNEERRRFVGMVLAFLDTHPDVTDMKVRLDYINLYTMDKRALVEHHINVSNLAI